MYIKNKTTNQEKVLKNDNNLIEMSVKGKKSKILNFQRINQKENNIYKSSTKNFGDFIFDFLKSFDNYGVPVTLNYKGN